MKRMTVAMLAGGALALSACAGGNAEMEAKYLDRLDGAGLMSSDNHTIEIGYQVCDRLKDGWSSTDVSTALLTAPDGSLTPYQAGLITGAATAAFCPKYI